MGLYIVEEKDIDNFFEVVENLDVEIDKVGKLGIALGKLLRREVDIKVVEND